MTRLLGLPEPVSVVAAELVAPVESTANQPGKVALLVQVKEAPEVEGRLSKDCW